MSLDRSSRGAVAIVYAVALLAVAVVFLITGNAAVRGIAVALAFAFCFWQTSFHMVPRRKCTPAEGEVMSVADGRVVSVKKMYEREYLCRECLMVSVYMDFWDKHANFWPLSGTVSYTMYHPGRHFLAFKPKASEENEHACMCVRTQDGKEVFFKLLAGGFARRIACYGRVEDVVQAGEQCGIIKFGSRVDMYLPLDSHILVKPGDYVRACKSAIAKLF